MEKYKKIKPILFTSILLRSYTKTFRRKHVFITIFLLILFLLPSLLTAFAGYKYTIYFYNPETNINNFASLKKEFDTYLATFGDYQLQPFSERETFEKVIVGKKDGVFLVSSWHYKKLRENISVEPVLVAVFKNKTTYKRILSVKKNLTTISSLRGINVASASSEDYTKNILRSMLGKDNEGIVDSMKILTVPKDIDALLSVGFGVAGAALTTENSLTKLAMINQKQYEMLKQMAVSEEILLPILAIHKPVDNDNMKLIKIMKEMDALPGGKNKLNMLGLDRWKELGELEKKSLEKE
jgi:hypothetical protein